MNIKVEVTQQDIDRGCPSNAYFCPIAQSFRRRGIDEVEVDGALIIWTEDGIQRSCEMPPVAGEFIRKFDRYQEVQPFTFNLIKDEP